MKTEITFYQPLFNLLSKEHDIILLESEMDQIIKTVQEMLNICYEPFAAQREQQTSIEFGNWFKNSDWEFHDNPTEGKIYKNKKTKKLKMLNDIFDIWYKGFVTSKQQSNG